MELLVYNFTCSVRENQQLSYYHSFYFSIFLALIFCLYDSVCDFAETTKPI